MATKFTFDIFVKNNRIYDLNNELIHITDIERHYLDDLPDVVGKDIVGLYQILNSCINTGILNKPHSNETLNTGFTGNLQKVLRTTGAGFLCDFENKDDFSKNKVQTIFETFYGLLLFSKNRLNIGAQNITDYFNAHICDKGGHEGFVFFELKGFKKYLSRLNGYFWQSNSDGSHRLIGAIYYNKYALENNLPLVENINATVGMNEYDGDFIDKIIDERIYFDDLGENVMGGGFGDNTTLYYNVRNANIRILYRSLAKYDLRINDGCELYYSEILSLKRFIKKSRWIGLFRGKTFRDFIINLNKLLEDYEKKRIYLQSK